MNKQEKLTPENIASLQKMMQQTNWFLLILLLIVLTVSIILFYTSVSNKIFYIILINVGFIPICFLLLKEQKAAKDDLANGLKNIINGTITELTYSKTQNLIHIDKIPYPIPKQLMQFNVGENIQIEISPMCKYLFKITKMEEIEEK